MTSFKTYLAEIDRDDSVYAKDAAEWVMSNYKVDGKWQTLPLKHPFWKPGYRCVYLPRGNGIFKMAVLQGEKPVVALEFDTKISRVPGGQLTGVEIDSVSALESVRGTGLVLRTYEALVESGQVLFSSTSQTSGSHKLWTALVKSPKVVPFVFANASAAEWYIDRYGDEDIKEQQPLNVLLTGSMSKMVDEAYASQETRWLVVPVDLPGLDRLRDSAIKLG